MLGRTLSLGGSLTAVLGFSDKRFTAHQAAMRQSGRTFGAVQGLLPIANKTSGGDLMFSKVIIFHTNNDGKDLSKIQK